MPVLSNHAGSILKDRILVTNLNASIRYDAESALGPGFDFHANVMEVRPMSVTSGLDGAGGRRLGSIGWLD